ncbi:MAG: hypothetical protein AB1720_08615 [Pseudomonadota bacterium]
MPSWALPAFIAFVTWGLWALLPRITTGILIRAACCSSRRWGPS